MRRAVGVVLLVVLVPVAVSYTRAMLRPSNVGLGVRSVEWMRDHGAAWLVNDVERVWYSLHAPSTGGTPLRALPRVGLTAGPPRSAPRAPRRGHRFYRPPRVSPVVRPPLLGEGRWRPTGPALAGGPPVLAATYRPDPAYPELVAGIAWLDHSRTRLRLYPGRYEPPSATVRGPEEVPISARRGLLASFNSGFKLEDAQGGFVASGRTEAPLVSGRATLVVYASGRVDVRAWRGPARPGAAVLYARQNLPLIVDRRRPNPNLNDGPDWGATLGNAIRVWRSGVGVDRRGNLIYAAANDQTVGSLAAILIHAGAVRAMELDINYEWVSFNTYARRHAGGAAKLLPGMDRPASRYLSPDDRDFFAVFAKGRS